MPGGERDRAGVGGVVGERAADERLDVGPAALVDGDRGAVRGGDADEGAAVAVVADL
jgi:hypothetical protein